MALFCADLHLSARRPEWRGEEDYAAVCRRKLERIMSLATGHGIPVFIAGDVFDRPRDLDALDLYLNVPKPEKGVYAVKGQHDMVCHNEKEKSAFDIAVSAGHLSALNLHRLDSTVLVRGCGWGQKIPGPPFGGVADILVIHRTYWMGEPVVPGQVEGNAETALKTELKDFDLVFSGDNHIPFTLSDGRRLMYNCGAICRRNIEQRKWHPSVYILYDDLTVAPFPLETDGGVWLTAQQEERKRHADAGAAFVDKLAGGGWKAQDSYRDILKAEGNARLGTPEGDMLLELATVEKKP